MARLEERMSTGKGKFSLLSYLEEAVTQAQMRDHIVAMQPQAGQAGQGYREMAVELRLEAVPWPQLLNLLVKLESSPHLLQVKRLHVQPRFDASHQLEATLLVSTYESEQ